MVVTVKCNHLFLMTTTALYFIPRLCPQEVGRRDPGTFVRKAADFYCIITFVIDVEHSLYTKHHDFVIEYVCASCLTPLPLSILGNINTTDTSAGSLHSHQS